MTFIKLNIIDIVHNVQDTSDHAGVFSIFTLMHIFPAPQISLELVEQSEVEIRGSAQVDKTSELFYIRCPVESSRVVNLLINYFT